MAITDLLPEEYQDPHYDDLVASFVALEQDRIDGDSSLGTLLTNAVTALLKIAARNPDTIIVGSIVRNGDNAITSAAVTWPDGVPGVYTADTLSVAFPGATDGYHITYGDPVIRTFTQPTVTRNGSGRLTVIPAIEVA